MSKIKFDVSGSDPSKAIQDSEPPKPGVYRCKVDEINSGFAKGDDGKPDKSRPRLEVIYRITVGKSKGAPLWDYVSFSEAAQWKLDQFLQAMGVATSKKRKGEFDTAKLINKVVKVRVVADKNNDGDYRPKVKGVFAIGEDDDVDDDVDDEDEADEEEADEDDEEDDDSDEDDEEEESTVDPNHPMMKLGAEADAGGRPGKVAEKKLKTAAAEADLDPDDYDSWTALAEALAEAEDEDEDDEDEEESEDDDDGYDDLTPVKLKAELKERGLKTAGTKEALIKRLRDDDSKEDPF